MCPCLSKLRTFIDIVTLTSFIFRSNAPLCLYYSTRSSLEQGAIFLGFEDWEGSPANPQLVEPASYKLLSLML